MDEHLSVNPNFKIRNEYPGIHKEKDLKITVFPGKTGND
jgi:hypothetical protein